MFIRNNTPNDIGPIACEGYNFVIPAKKVCAIWDKAGELITKRLYNIEANTPEDGGSVLPPVSEVERKDWDGTHAQVSRFQIDATRIPGKADVLKIAKQRGVDKEYINDANAEGSTVELVDVIDTINKLSIPEEVMYAEKVQTETPDVE